MACRRSASVSPSLASSPRPSASLPRRAERFGRLLDAVLAAGLGERPEHPLPAGQPPRHLAEARAPSPEDRPPAVGSSSSTRSRLSSRAGPLDGLGEPVGRRHDSAHRPGRVRIPQEHAERAFAALDAAQERAGSAEHRLQVLQHPALVVDERVEKPPALLDLPEDAVDALRAPSAPRPASAPPRPPARRPGDRPGHGRRAARSRRPAAARLAGVGQRGSELPVIHESVEHALAALDLGRQAPERAQGLRDVLLRAELPVTRARPPAAPRRGPPGSGAAPFPAG